MSWKCIIGLATCLQSQGHWIPEEDVFLILDVCSYMAKFSTREFEYTDGQGSLHLWLLGEHGLRIAPDENPAKRKRNALEACREIRRDFNDKSNWKFE